MARINVQKHDLEWLKESHEQHSYAEMAKRIGCCVDTLKRILVREGLQEFDGAKYQVKRDSDIQKWARPCLGCGNEEPRPRMWFFCTSCRRRRGYSE